LVQAAAECEMAITNGNPNSLAGFLLAGKPQLAVPYTMEKYLIARRLELLGAGLSAPMRRPGNLAAKLRAVLMQRNFRRAAESFAARYAGGSEAALVQRMRERLALRTC
jgi:UDP:flavonoid glycosyltransferase YjiC (YdhE family)